MANDKAYVDDLTARLVKKGRKQLAKINETQAADMMLRIDERLLPKPGKLARAKDRRRDALKHEITPRGVELKALDPWAIDVGLVEEMAMLHASVEEISAYFGMHDAQFRQVMADRPDVAEAVINGPLRGAVRLRRLQWRIADNDENRAQGQMALHLGANILNQRAASSLAPVGGTTVNIGYVQLLQQAAKQVEPRVIDAEAGQ